MAGSASNYLENKLIDHSLGTTTFTKPTTVYAALYTVAPSDSSAGTEVTGGSYARQAITFSAASSGSTSNNTKFCLICTISNYIYMPFLKIYIKTGLKIKIYST